MKEYLCTICGYTVKSETVPEVCPICYAGPEKFVELTDEAREKYAHLLQDV